MTEFPSGWTCKTTILCFERYLLATLPLRESLAVAEHIEACVHCAERLDLAQLRREGPARRGR